MENAKWCHKRKSALGVAIFLAVSLIKIKLFIYLFFFLFQIYLPGIILLFFVEPQAFNYFYTLASNASVLRITILFVLCLQALNLGFLLYGIYKVCQLIYIYIYAEIIDFLLTLQ